MSQVVIVTLPIHAKSERELKLSLDDGMSGELSVMKP